MSAYRLRLHGEDVLTFGVDLDDHDAALLQRIARMTEDLRSGYEPYMTVTPVEADPDA